MDHFGSLIVFCLKDIKKQPLKVSVNEGTVFKRLYHQTNKRTSGSPKRCQFQNLNF